MVLYALLSTIFMIIMGILGLVLGLRAPHQIARIFGWLVMLGMLVLILNGIFGNSWLRFP